MAKLIVMDGPERGEEFMLRTRNVLGRHHDCSVVLKDQEISATHCKIEKVSADEFSISDLGSSNGTFVNQQKITSQKLKFGDIIAIGKSRFLFQPFAEELTDSATAVINMRKVISEGGKLLHCNKPMAKEWSFCPYCGDPLNS